MKQLLMVLALMTLAACAKNEGSSSPQAPCAGVDIVGAWANQSDSSHVMTFTNQCTGTDTHCGSTFQYGVVAGTNIIEMVVLQTNTVAGCPHAGTSENRYHVNNPTNMVFAYSIAGGGYFFDRIQ